MNWILGFLGIAITCNRLGWPGIEMRKIRLTTYRDEELASANIFTK